MRKLWLPFWARCWRRSRCEAKARRLREISLKSRTVAVRIRSACANTVTQSSSPTEAQRRDAREMAQRARQSAILGDATASLSQLRGAAGLDPGIRMSRTSWRARTRGRCNSNTAARILPVSFARPNAAEARRRATSRRSRRQGPTPWSRSRNGVQRGVDASTRASGRTRRCSSPPSCGSIRRRRTRTTTVRWCGRCRIIAMEPRTTTSVTSASPRGARSHRVFARVKRCARGACRRRRRSGWAWSYRAAVSLHEASDPRHPVPRRRRRRRGLRDDREDDDGDQTQTANDPFGNKYSYSVTTAHKTRPSRFRDSPRPAGSRC